jgi:hypothetical protein
LCNLWSIQVDFESLVVVDAAVEETEVKEFRSKQFGFCCFGLDSLESNWQFAVAFDYLNDYCTSIEWNQHLNWIICSIANELIFALEA